VSCVKTAEPIEIQFDTLSRVRPGNITWECRYPHEKGHFLGCLANWKALWSIGGSDKRVSWAKNRWTDRNNL